MRIIATSDTHNNSPQIPEGDVFIHCGDLTAHGTDKELDAAFSWIACLPHAIKIVVGGNHDKGLQGAAVRHKVNYLQDSGVVFKGALFWGSPWVPNFPGTWAFTADEERLAQYFARIPHDVDVLVTHGPPQGILDRTAPNHRHKGEHAGSAALRTVVDARQPLLHLFGHIHEAHGMEMNGKTMHVNCAWVGVDPETGGPIKANAPVVLDLQ